MCSDRPCNLARACLKRLLERSSVPVSRVRWQLSAASRCSGSSRRCAAEDTIGKVAETQHSLQTHGVPREMAVFCRQPLQRVQQPLHDIWLQQHDAELATGIRIPAWDR